MEQLDEISSDFKVQWLNTTLKFIKDDQKMFYEYPEMSLTVLNHLKSLISQDKNDVGFGFKTLYAPLWEAIQIFSVTYTFKVSIIYTKNKGKGKLLIEKIPKSNEDKYAIDSDEEVNSNSCRHQFTKNMGVSEKYYLQMRKIIENVSPAFIKSILQAILDFVCEETRGSVEFKDLAPAESLFIENIIDIHDKKQQFLKLFSPACIDILKRISLNLESLKNIKLQVSSAKKDAETAKREINITKVPFYDDDKISNNTSNATKKKNKSKKKSSTSCVDSVNFVKNQSRSQSESCNDSESSPKIDMKSSRNVIDKSEEADDNRVLPDNRDQKRSVSSESCNDKSMLQLDLKSIDDRKETSPISNVPKITSPKLEEPNSSSASSPRSRPSEGRSDSPGSQGSKMNLKIKGKNRAMAEAMSVPFESNKGLRMMLRMGWKGGALGLRGYGITEPIIPALNLKPGAGLGSKQCEQPKQKTKNSKATDLTPTELRIQFLEGVHNTLLKKDTCVVKFERLLKKERHFFKVALNFFNRRNTISLASPREQELVTLILTELYKDPEISLDLKYVENDCDVELSLITWEQETQKDAIQPTKKTPKAIKKKLLDDFLRDIKQRIINFEISEDKPVKVTIKAALKVHILDNLLDFSRSSLAYFEIDCHFGYEKRLYEYVKALCVTLRDGVFSKKVNKMESVMINDIRKNLNGQCLEPDRCHQIISFKKIITNQSEVEKKSIVADRKDNQQDIVVISDDEISDDDDNSNGDSSYCSLTRKNSKKKQTKESCTIDQDSRNISLDTIDDLKKCKKSNMQINKDDNNKFITKFSKSVDVQLRNLNVIADKSHKSDVFGTDKCNGNIKVNIPTDKHFIKDNIKIKNYDKIKLNDINSISASDKSIQEHSETKKIENKDNNNSMIKKTILEDLTKTLLPNTNSKPNCYKKSVAETFINNKFIGNNSNKTKEQLILDSTINTTENFDKIKICIIHYKEYNIVKILSQNNLITIKEISKHIQECITKTNVKDNCLKCHGIQNNALVYSNGNWDVLLSEKFSINYIIGCIDKFRMRLRINSFVSVKEFLSSIEMYNIGLVARDWLVSEDNGDFIVQMNLDSFKFICDKQFLLPAGFDTATFTVLL